MASDVQATLLAGRYRLINRLGSGGMAAVFLAEDERLGRRVAVKRLHAHSPEDTARRFGREARIGASLNHPNLVTVFDTVTEDETVLIVMEYVDGETLAQAIKRGPLPPDQATKVVRGVAEALDHAHEQGIVHRDVKPANILLGRDGSVKLVDLGIATALESTRITAAGSVLGTAAYMAPEQLDGRDAGPRADVYALAICTYEMLTGQRAYRGTSPVEIAHQVVEGPGPDLPTAWPEAPPAAAAAIAQAISFDPGARQPTAGRFADELADAFVPRRPAPAAVVRRRPPLVPVVAVLLIAALAIGVALLVTSGGGGGDGGDKSPSAAAQQRKSDRRAKRRADAAAKKDQTTTQAQAPTAEPATPPTTTATPEPSGNDPATGARLQQQGHSLIDKGDYAGAVDVLQRAVAQFPAGTNDLNYAYALYDLGHALRLAGRPADAIPVLEKRLKIDNQRDVVQAELAKAREDAKG